MNILIKKAIALAIIIILLADLLRLSWLGLHGWGKVYRYRIVPPDEATFFNKVHLWISVLGEAVMGYLIYVYALTSS